MRIKPGVSLIGTHPALGFADQVAEQIWIRHGASELWVTSSTDGAHSRNSRHYVGLGRDYRTKSGLPGGLPTSAAKRSAAKELKLALGWIDWNSPGEFRVILEDLGGRNEHVHVQFNGSQR